MERDADPIWHPCARGVRSQFGPFVWRVQRCVRELCMDDSGRIDALVFSGYNSCDFVGGMAHWLGSLGYEQSDADTFTGWGADYLKVCCVLRTTVHGPASSITHSVRQLLRGEQNRLRGQLSSYPGRGNVDVLAPIPSTHLC